MSIFCHLRITANFVEGIRGSISVKRDDEKGVSVLVDVTEKMWGVNRGYFQSKQGVKNGSIFFTSKSPETLQAVSDAQYQSKEVIKEGGKIFEIGEKFEGVKRGCSQSNWGSKMGTYFFVSDSRQTLRGVLE